MKVSLNKILVLSQVMIILLGCSKKDPCTTSVTLALDMQSSPFDNAACVDPGLVPVGIYVEGQMKNGCTKVETNHGNPKTSTWNRPLPGIVSPYPLIHISGPPSSTVSYTVTLEAQCCTGTVDASSCNNMNRGAKNVLRAKGTAVLYKPLTGSTNVVTLNSASFVIVNKNCCP
jgi:hypothetical protein